MNAAGIAVYSFDHYGHGKTQSKLGHFPSYEAALFSVEELLIEAKADFPTLPLFIMGHSLGGNLVANLALKRKPDVKGVVLSAPYFRLAFSPSSVDVFLAKTMINIYPSFTQSSKLDASAISRDGKEVKKYKDDPLVHDLVSPVLFLGCHQAGEWAFEHAGDWKHPLLIMHGTEDRLTSHEASEAFAKAAEGFGKSDVTLKLWDGLFHEMHNEPEKEEVLKTVSDWVLARV
ncbi:UNVERIFIED_CONTAM: hypothetical protein GTU68_003330 [Idotea baltica]|nr:hypothetical protein [Idotea baltica]